MIQLVRPLAKGHLFLPVAGPLGGPRPGWSSDSSLDSLFQFLLYLTVSHFSLLDKGFKQLKQDSLFFKSHFLNITESYEKIVA